MRTEKELDESKFDYWHPNAGCQISFIGYALKLGGSVHNYSNSDGVKFFL